MKNITRITSILIVALFLLSCKKVLEKFPTDKPADVTFLQTEAELSIAVNGIYNNLWLNSISASGQWEYILDNATDIGWDRNASIVTFVGNGSHSSSTASLADIWMHFYTGIARANYVIANLAKVADASQQSLDRADGQARLLRAYWYSQLITLWGDVPLITVPQGLSENQVARTPKDEVVDFLLADLDTAALKLPVTWTGNDKGRVTKGAANALKSRIALAASRFDVAAAAAKVVIDAQTYSLYPNYTDLFTYAGESNAEVILEVNFQYGITDHRMPISIFSRNSQGNSTKIPTQSMVDSYECIDGLPIDESPLYNPARPFDNRDPRLKQTIAVPGDIYLGFQFETHKDSVLCWNYNLVPARRVTNQEATNPFASFSGYCWKKTADAKDLGAFRNASSLNFILIRLGEVLLNYAEAKIELNQIDNTCLTAINRVRGRATVNMPAIPAGKTQVQMREIIRRERKVELAMEGLRLQDIRRWKIAEKVMAGPLYGRPQKPFNYSNQGIPSIDQDGVVNYSAYADKLSVIEQRTFNANRDYLLPIPQREMDINKLLVQNPNY
jgi:hypothetical protein